MIDQHPFSDICVDDAPLMRQEIGGLTLSGKRRDVYRFFWRVTGIAVRLTAIYIGIMLITTRCPNPDPMNPSSCDFAHVAGAAIRQPIFAFVALVILTMGLCLGLLFDVDFVSSPGARLIHERDSGHLDLVRITTLTAEQIIAAKYVGAQLRAGRTVTIEVALRAATIVVFSINELMIVSTYFNAPGFVAHLLTVIIVGVVYLLEPIWRMHMVVSMGLATSIRTHNVVSLTVTNIGALFTMRLAQGFLAGGYFLLTGLISVFVVGSAGGYQWYLWNTPLSLALFGLCIYLFYRTGRRWMLRRAVRLIR